MKINRLRLTNIGVFYGDYDFNLKTNTNHENIVLIGGKNGSGKTTILESIRLALYGPLAFGYKTETDSYFEKIEAKLNTQALKNHENKYQIILDFEINENFEKNSYTLRRSWMRSKNSIKEVLIIYRNHRELSNQEKEIFVSKLREEMPPQLLEFFLFDGERISNIVSDDTLPDYLQKSAKVMFNLDLFETLETDLQMFIKHGAIKIKLTEVEKQILENKDKLTTLIDQRSSLLDEKIQIEKEIDEQRALLNSLKKRYEVYGGLMKEQRDALLQEMNQIEQYRGGLMEKTKELISTIMPFCIVRDLLADVVSQMEIESRNEIISNLTKVINGNQVSHSLKHLQENGDITVNGDLDLVASRFIVRLLENIDHCDITPIHNASVHQRMEVELLYKETMQLDPEIIKNNFIENDRLIEQLQDIRNKINANDSSSELKELLDEMNQIHNTLAVLQHRMGQLMVNLSLLEEQISAELKKSDQLKAKLIQSRKSNNVFYVVNKVLDVSKKFRSIQLKKKLQQVEMETVKMLQLLFRKELFVVRVHIDPDTFVLRLFNRNNEEINKDILSAGEKQILLMATIWAMAKCSKRELPFVFDTLFGRLDQTHKQSIIKHFLPKCGKQVIILSTDSEIDVQHYELIKPRIAREYTIEYNTLNSTVEKSEEYFHFQRSKGAAII